MPEEHLFKKKRFVVCLDGTWNNAAAEVERKKKSEEGNSKGLWERFSDSMPWNEKDENDSNKVYRPTNVLKLARAIDINAADALQVTYYDSGVGAMNRAPTGGARVIKVTDNILGGMLGAGFEENIEEAYTFLANNYEAGDEIFVFGFSRGAAQARSLCSFIAWAGGFPDKDDVYYAPRLFTRYLEQYGAGTTGPQFWDEMNERRAEEGREFLKPLKPAQIQFLGVWDTVLSLGRRLRRKTPLKHQFHNSKTVPKSVVCARHAIAIDEARHDFQPEIFDDPGHQDLEQRWFPGVHSNVGGGLGDDSLANGALKWMVAEAQSNGLVVDEKFLNYFRSVPTGWAGEKSIGFSIGDTIGKPFRGYEGVRYMSPYPRTTLDDSVVSRLNATGLMSDENDQLYRPSNLLDYLRESPHYQDALENAVTRSL